MSKTTERRIIDEALKHHGLLSSSELKFVMNISRLPNHVRLSARSRTWLYDIGRKKLDMVLPDPEPVAVIDYRARACA